jgi:hypothetical protein
MIAAASIRIDPPPTMFNRLSQLDTASFQLEDELGKTRVYDPPRYANTVTEATFLQCLANSPDDVKQSEPSRNRSDRAMYKGQPAECGPVDGTRSSH